MIQYKNYLKVMCAAILIAQAANAGVMKDIRRVSLGVSAGVALGYGLTYLNESHMVNAGLISEKTVPACALIGALVGSWFTSYGKAFRAQVALLNIDDKLIEIVMEATYGKTTAEIVDDIQDYYRDTALPLVEGIRNLVKQDDYLGAAIQLLEFAVDEAMDDDPVLQEKYTKWIDELITIRTYVRYAVTIIKGDPRFAELFKHKELQDLNLKAY